jgi:hypothetical protein
MDRGDVPPLGEGMNANEELGPCQEVGRAGGQIAVSEAAGRWGCRSFIAVLSLYISAGKRSL